MEMNIKSSLLLEALQKPDAYPHKPRNVEFTQTQMSLVFLTGDFAFKIKKPVNLGYLDYTTLEKRHFFCEQEVKLNRRLSPEIYLEVVPVVQKGDRITVGGEGNIIDYAVKMKQLPREKTLDNLLLKDQVTTDMVAKVASKLAAFHKQAITNATISTFGKPDAILVNIEENASQTRKYLGRSISYTIYERVAAYNERFTREHRLLFQKRVAEGRIKDCHGDLHAAHVCFSNGLYIFDCIEFNDRFRYGDVASEVAFLAMDLDRYGRADLSQSFVNNYVTYSKDEDLLHLLNFYKCYRAYVRGKVESFQLDDELIKDKKTALATAKSYFNLAHSYARDKLLLILVAGTVGTGKTTLARALSMNTGFVIISSDVTRKKLADIPATEHRFEDFRDGIYSADFSKKTYDKMYAQANALLLQGQSVILDASFMKKEERAKAQRLSRETGAGFLIIECVLNEDTIKKRLEQRLKETTVSDGRWEIYESQRKDFDIISEFTPQNHIIVDTSPETGITVEDIMERIY